MLRWIASALFVASLTSAAGPVRLLVIGNSTQGIPPAKEAFDKAFGPGLLEVEIAPQPSPAQIARAGVIFTYFAHPALLQQLAPHMQAAHRRGAIFLAAPTASLDRMWGFNVDPQRNRNVEEYWREGGIENLTSFLAHAYTQGGGASKLRIAPPVSQMTMGIYHPRAAQALASLTEYLAWYRAQRLVAPGAPLAGITMYAANYKFGDRAHIDSLITALERKNIGVVAMFGWPVAAMDNLLALNPEEAKAGKSPLRLLLALNLTIPKPEDAVALQRYGLHTINLIATRESYAEWSENPRGVNGDRVPLLIASPERAGASEPILFATFEEIPGQASKLSVPVPERVDLIARRAARWIALQDKPNSAKRIGLIYFNNPPGKGNIGASYFASIPSMAAMLARMQAEGYDLGPNRPTSQELQTLLERHGRNVETWAPGELMEMVKAGGLAFVTMSQYRKWFAALPENYREATLKTWGPPEKSPIMLIDWYNGEKVFVIPGLRLGNLYVGPQPLRSTFDQGADTAHDTITPPPHNYIAAYLWYRNVYQADALVHIGRHGTLEWLPGKQVGQAGWDPSEVLLGDLPNANYYIQDGGGEAIQAKRRSAAVLISHLTPLILAGGKQAQWTQLHDLVEQYEKAASTGGSQQLLAEYQRSIRTEVARTRLDRQLGLDTGNPAWAEFEERLHTFLHSIENDPIPAGIHTAGALPPEPVQRESLTEFLKYGFSSSELTQLGGRLAQWSNQIFDGHTPEVDQALPPALRDKAQTLLAEGCTWIQNLRRSPALELDALVTVLNGRYLPSGPLGDPLRVSRGLPTGRNLHGFDPALIPTPAAWQAGKKMAEQTLAKYRKARGGYPAKVSMVLWYGETDRHQGAFESEALWLMGVEPQWNARGIVDNLRVIPESELGRPRIDVVFTISGIYRDGFGDKIAMLDKAARLAAAAGDNAISRNDREAKAAFLKSGLDNATAERFARARVFGAKPGNYGIGVQKVVERSKDIDDKAALASVYLHFMNFAFSSEGWGESAPQALATHLKGNQAVLFSRSSNTYGILDNDDTYQYVGGLNLASKSVNQGTAPEFYIHNLRKSGQEATVDARSWLANELNGRSWNPKWIDNMKRSGYAGARAMFKEIEHLYGFQATAEEQMSSEFWQQTYDVYVADKHGLEMKKFFNETNPHARQWIVSRLLEVDRQGSHKFSDADRQTLVAEYVRGVNQHGMTCSANTCGNARVHQFIAAEAAHVPGLGKAELQQFGARMAKATGWTASQFTAAPGAVKAGMQSAPRPQLAMLPPTSPTAAGTPKPRPSPAGAAQPVKGFEMKEKILRIADPAANPAAPLAPGYLLAMAVLIVFGFSRERWLRPRLN